MGEALIDLVGVRTEGPGAQRFDAYPGGSPLNVAVGLSRLAAPAAMMARLADDAFGRILRQHAAGNGVDLSAAPTAAEPTTLAVVSLDDAGHASYDFYLNGTADWQWTDDELAAMPADTTILHTGSLAAWTDPGQQRIAALVDRVRGELLVSFDPNVRPRLLGSPEGGRALIERSVRAAHLVKASDADLDWLYPGESADSVARRWADMGPALVVVTCGADGVLARTCAGVAVRRPAIAIELVDTVGAGDAFSSGLLAAVNDRDLARPQALATIAADVLTAIVDDAGLVAALTCERPGADPPTAQEVADARFRLPQKDH